MLRLPRWWLVALALSAALPSAAAGEPALPVGPLHPAGRWIEDATGRVIIVHGLELSRKTPPYFPPAASFTADDVANIEKWGFDAVRLAWFWKGLEPARGQIDRDYLNQLLSDSMLLADHHVFTLLEAHQDGYNETVGGAGFPDWATITDKTWAPLESVPGVGIFDLQAARAFDHLYANTDGIADAFARAWKALAAAFAVNPMMLGYDLFNEPGPGSQWETCANPAGCPAFDLATLEPLEDKLAAAVRSADPRTIAFYEPNIYFDVGTPSWLRTPPRASGPAGFAFHDYCLAGLIGQPDHESQSTGYPICQAEDEWVFANAMRTSTVMGVPPLFDEFGDTQDLSQIARVTKLADQNLTGWLYWSYKDWVDDPGGAGSGPLFDDSDDNGTLRQAKLSLLSQPYPLATAGIPTAESFDGNEDTFTFTYVPSHRISAPTVVFTAPLHYPHGYTVAVRGATVESAPNAAYLELKPQRDANRVTLRLRPATGSAMPMPSAPQPGPLTPSTAPLAPLALGAAAGSCDANADRPTPVGSPILTGGASDMVARVQTERGAGEVTNSTGISTAYGPGDETWTELGSVPIGGAGRATVICRSGPATFNFTFGQAPVLPASFTGSSTHEVNVSLASSRLAFVVPAAIRYVADVHLTAGAIELGMRRHDNSTPPATTFMTDGRKDLGTLDPGPASLDVTALPGPQAHWTVSIHALP
jgi:endoglycosylceramidase